MALSKANLGFPIVVSAGTTGTLVQVSSGKTCYVRSVIIFNNNVSTATTSQTIQVYMVPNSGGSVGTATVGNRIARVTLTPDDTFFFEPQYPITLQNTGDSIQIFNEGSIAFTLSGYSTSTSPVNAFALGDREA